MLNQDIELRNFEILLNDNPFSIQTVKDPRSLYQKTTTKTEIWGLIWPSSIITCRVLSGIPLENLSIVDLGCGSGLVSTFAATKNSKFVQALDYVSEAIELTALNLKSFSNSQARKFNWFNDIPNDLLNRFDLMVGADIVYLRRTYSHIAKCFQMINQDGCIMIVEADRPIEEFLQFLDSLPMQKSVIRAQNIGTEVGEIKNLTIMVVYNNPDGTAKLILDHLSNIFEQ